MPQDGKDWVSLVISGAESKKPQPVNHTIVVTRTNLFHSARFSCNNRRHRQAQVATRVSDNFSRSAEKSAGDLLIDRQSEVPT